MSGENQHNLYGVSLYTWGSEDDGGNGMFKQLDVQLFGGNVGHAAICLRIPADERGKALIDKYCQESDTHEEVPHIKKTIQVKKAVFDEEAGKAVQTDEIVVEQEVYEVYFSFWPVEEDKPRKRGRTQPKEGEQVDTFNFEDELSGDNLDERSGVDFSMSETWVQYLQPEQRSQKGILGGGMLTLGPKRVAHLRDLSQEQIVSLQNARIMEQCEDDLESLKTIMKKFEKFEELPAQENTKKKLALSKTNIFYLDRIVSGWKTGIENTDSISLKQYQELLLPKIKTKIKQLALVEKKDQFLEMYNLRTQLEDSYKSKKQLNLEEHVVETFNSIEDLFEKDFQGRFKERFKEGQILSPEAVKEIYENCQDILKNNMHPIVENSVAIDQLQDALEALKNAKEVFSRERIKIEDIEGYENLDYVNKLLGDNYSWRQVLSDPEKETITFEEIEKLYAKFSEALTARKKGEYLVFDVDEDAIEYEEDYLTQGKPPDHVVTLPINYFDPNNKGLDVELMLAKMHDFANNKESEFDLIFQNCSVTTNAILEAGMANQPHLQQFMQNYAFGFFGNPQEVYNNASRLREAIRTDGHVPVFERLNPLEKIGGFLIGIVLDGDQSKTKRTASGFGLFFVGVVKLPVSLVSSLLSPTKAFNKSSFFVRYAFGQKPIGLTDFLKKSPLYLAGVIVAPFAVVYRVLSPLEKTFNWLSRLGRKKKTLQAMGKHNISKLVNQETPKRRLTVSQALLENTEIIKRQTIEEALAAFEEILQKKTNIVPVFEKSIQKKIIQKMNQKGQEDLKKKYEQLCEKAYQRLSQQQKHLLQATKPPQKEEVPKNEEPKLHSERVIATRQKVFGRGRREITAQKTGLVKLKSQQENEDISIETLVKWAGSQENDEIKEALKEFKRHKDLWKKVNNSKRSIESRIKLLNKSPLMKSFKGDKNNLTGRQAYLEKAYKEKLNVLKALYRAKFGLKEER